MALKPCGICFEPSRTLFGVSSDCGDNLSVIEKLLKVAPFQDWLECKSICQNCRNLLDASYFFIDLCCKYKENQRKFATKINEGHQGPSQEENCNSISLDNGSSNGDDEQIEGEYVEIDDVLDREQLKTDNLNTDSTLTTPASTSQDKNVSPTRTASKKEFYCSLCDKGFASLISLEMHFKYSDHRNKCKICSAVFTDSALLDAHVTSEHPGLVNRFSCEVCSEEFSFERALIEHCVVEHQMEKSTVKPYSCNLCQKRLTGSSNFKRHLLYHEGIRRFTCTFCGKGFVMKKDLGEHERIHFNEKKYRCAKCEKGFNTNANLRTHNLGKHTDPSKWRHQCDMCPKRFAMKSTLLEHIKRHKGIKDHQCMVCGSLFTTKYDMDSHMYYHTKDRPHKCDLCPDRSYRDRKGLKVHNFRVHGKAMRELDEDE